MRTLSRHAILAAVLVAGAGLVQVASAEDLKVVSDKTATGFKYPETVAYDPGSKVLYVSQFGSELKATRKDGAGRISKVSLDGTVEEETFLPANGQTLDKPKGIWVSVNNLWVTDIDSVWEFDTRTKKGKKVALPGAQFANDVTVIGDAAYVSDNRGDQLYRVEPADFLHGGGEPKVTKAFSGAGVNPNGLYPAGDGGLLLVGFKSDKEPRAIYRMAPGAEPEAISKPIGRLDGVYQMPDGELLVTDWDSGSLGRWNADQGYRPLASGLKGPADFAVVPTEDGLLVVVPDLAANKLRLIRLGK